MTVRWCRRFDKSIQTIIGGNLHYHCVTLIAELIRAKFFWAYIDVEDCTSRGIVSLPFSLSVEKSFVRYSACLIARAGRIAWNSLIRFQRHARTRCHLRGPSSCSYCPVVSLYVNDRFHIGMRYRPVEYKLNHSVIRCFFISKGFRHTNKPTAHEVHWMFVK